MKTKEQLLLEIRGELKFKAGDTVKVKGAVYETPYDLEGAILEDEIEATVFDLIVPGYWPYEITVGEVSFFAPEESLKEVN